VPKFQAVAPGWKYYPKSPMLYLPLSSTIYSCIFINVCICIPNKSPTCLQTDCAWNDMANQYSQKLGKPEHPVVYHHVPIKTAKTWWLIHNFADPPAPPRKNRVCNQHETKSPQLCPHVLGSPLLKIMVEEKTIATVAISDIHWIAMSPLYLNDCHIILPYSVG